MTRGELWYTRAYKGVWELTSCFCYSSVGSLPRFLFCRRRYRDVKWKKNTTRLKASLLFEIFKAFCEFLLHYSKIEFKKVTEHGVGISLELLAINDIGKLFPSRCKSARQYNASPNSSPSSEPLVTVSYLVYSCEQCNGWSVGLGIVLEWVSISLDSS